MAKPFESAQAPDWESLRDFLTVAEQGSLSAAARQLSVSQPTLTRRLAALESTLGADLLVRSPRGVTLTPLGDTLLQPLRQMREAARAVEVAATGEGRALEGPVRVTATDGLGIEWLTPRLAEFQREHPQIEIQLVLRQAVVNLLEREADIAVRLGRPRQADLVARRLGELAVGLFASPEYIARKGFPKTQADLDQHLGVSFERGMRGTRLIDPGVPAENIVYRANHLIALLSAVRAGYGVGCQALAIAAQHPELVRVAPEVERRVDLWIVTHRGVRRSARIRAVVDFLTTQFQNDADAMAGRPVAESRRVGSATR